MIPRAPVNAYRIVGYMEVGPQWRLRAIAGLILVSPGHVSLTRNAQIATMCPSRARSPILENLGHCQRR